MFLYEDYFKSINNDVFSKYHKSIDDIKEIAEKTQYYNGKKKKFARYFNYEANVIIKFYNFEKKLNNDYFELNDFDTLLRDNRKLYHDVLIENYKKSYLNPDQCLKIYGNDLGKLLTFLAYKINSMIVSGFKHKRFEMYEIINTFIRIYKIIFDNDKFNSEEIKRVLILLENNDLFTKQEIFIREQYSVEVRYYTDIVKYLDLTDLRYLFRFGCYISDNEIKMAQYLLKQPEEKIQSLAKTYAEGYKNGFARDNKDISKKSNVCIWYPIGQELVVREALKLFEEMGLNSVINNIKTTKANKQCDYDHRFDNALYIDEKYLAKKLNAISKALENNKVNLINYAGPAVIELFGEKPFKPKSTKGSYKLNEAQSKIFSNYKSDIDTLYSKYMPRDEISFTIIAFPSPEIGNLFENIFDETIEVNTLDSAKYEKIQDVIIKALDKAEFVHVKGKEGNETDIKIKMQLINNSEEQTNFYNCVADVNIPVGEVFTSPLLNQTNGILHVKEAFLRGLRYENLLLEFKDGYVERYQCTNFDNDEDNKKYIEENLLFPHKSLPLGEFAIGTNTTAYKMAKKFDIINLLPVLIVEKMGPHFAIGDTCFSWGEDTKVFNPLDNKEIIARDNERSLLRKEDVKKAYTQVHIDITLPYEDLADISAICADGQEISIIKDGLFVLEGTEELNEPLKELEQ